MDVLRCKTRQQSDCSVVKRSEEIEKLKRRKEINARYSRLLLSKTIKHFQQQGHVTICLSEKVNGNVDDEKSSIKKLSTNQLGVPKNRTISFWQFPKTLKCEFQIETNSPRAMKSVRTQTNFEKPKKKSEDPWSSNESLNQNRTTNTSNEIISSSVSNDGNVMSLVMRSKQNKGNEEDATTIKSSRRTQRNDPVTPSPRTPSRKYKSERSPRTQSRKRRSEFNVFRSKNFWASYNNFILCNRSIELRITKLYSFQNTQYIVAFSNDFFEYTENTAEVPPEKETSSIQTYFVIQFMKFNIEAACISETCYVEHITDLKMLIDRKVDATPHPGHYYADDSSDIRKIIVMTISGLVLSFFVLFVYIRNYADLLK